MYIVHGAVGLTSNLLDVSEIRFRRASTTVYASRDGLATASIMYRYLDKALASKQWQRFGSTIGELKP